MAKLARSYILVGLLISISALRAHAGLVQTNSGTPGALVSTYSVGFSSPVATSDLLLVAIGTNVPTATITSVTDTLGSTFTPATSLTTNTGWGIAEQVWIAAAKANGTDTVTINLSQAANVHLIIAEYSGIAAVVDATAVGGSSATTGTAVDSGVLTTVTPGDLLFGHVVTGHLNQTFAAGTGYTLRQTSPSGASAVEDQLVQATGSYHATFTLGTADYWICALLALKPAAVSTTPLPTISGVMNIIVQNLCSATVTTSCVNGFQITHIDPATGAKVIDASVGVSLNVAYTVNATGKDATGNATSVPPMAILFNFSPSP